MVANATMARRSERSSLAFSGHLALGRDKLWRLDRPGRFAPGSDPWIDDPNTLSEVKFAQCGVQVEINLRTTVSWIDYAPHNKYDVFGASAL